MPKTLTNDITVEVAAPQLVTHHPSHEGTVFLLYALTGFTGLLAEQGFERYIALPTFWDSRWAASQPVGSSKADESHAHC